MKFGHCDVAIIGAGGAGMMCAIQAGRRGRSVVLLEHAQTIGKKILISGGGRCNFTNVHTQAGAFVSNNPHFCTSALSRFRPEDFIQMVRDHGIAFHEKKLGQLFCDGSARQIVDLLVGECEKAGVVFHLGCHVSGIHKDRYFTLDTNQGRFIAESVVIATGGLSFPKIGASGFGHDLAKQFGLAVVPTAPALVGLRFDDGDRRTLGGLAGISFGAGVACGTASFREDVLFTHHGLSGPAILQASLYWSPGEPLSMKMLPELDIAAWLSAKQKEGGRAETKTILAERLPKRLAERFCERSEIAGPLAGVPTKKLQAFCRQLERWTFTPGGTEGYGKAEVTRGGVDTAELSSKTMEAHQVAGLFFVGEVVDVTGQLGGYNFQWAWASGAAAGQYV